MQEKLEMRQPESIAKLIEEVNKTIEFCNSLNEQQQIRQESFEKKNN